MIVLFSFYCQYDEFHNVEFLVNNGFIDMCVWNFTPPPPLYILKFDLLCYVLSFNVIVKCCEAAHAWVVSGAIDIFIYYDHYYYYVLPSTVGKAVKKGFV